MKLPDTGTKVNPVETPDVRTSDGHHFRFARSRAPRFLVSCLTIGVQSRGEVPDQIRKRSGSDLWTAPLRRETKRALVPAASGREAPK